MALINTLRNKMGKVVVGVIAFSIAAFVLADLLGPNSTLLGNNVTDVGEIAGEKVSHKDFLAKVDEFSFNFTQRFRRNPSSSELVSLRNQAWDALIAEIAYKGQYADIGLDVSNEEVIDMVQGDNISPEIKQAFTNPETGQFDKDQVVAYLKSLADQTPAQRANWYAFEKNLGPARLRLKYENLLLTTNYVTKDEAKQEYVNNAVTADIRYLYIPFLTVSDSLISYTEDELKAYLNEHEDEYQRERSRSLKHIKIDVIPSAEDSAVVLEEITNLKESLINAENDSIFAVLNSDSGLPFVTYKRDNLPKELNDTGDLSEGTVIGPALVGGKYTLYKISEIGEAEQYAAKASHILFKWDNESASAKARAKAEARKVLRQIKNGADFAEMARQYGQDGTASKGGDLGWFSDGRMVKPFEEAVYGARRKGLLNDVVETQHGYHIINVTETKTNEQFKVAKVELELYSSDETRNKFYREAEEFAVSCGNQEEFERNAEEKGYQVVNSIKIGPNDRRITQLNDARGVVSWLYNTAETGAVSDVFEIDDSYVIAVMTGEQEKGVARLNTVRNEIEAKVKNQKKADYVISKLGDAEGTLDEIAESYGKTANVYEMNGLKLSSNNLTGVGISPEAVGIAFSMENGERTAPFELVNGVMIIEMINKVEPGDISDLDPYKSQVAQKRQSRISFNIDATIKELSEIEDERYRFF